MSMENSHFLYFEQVIIKNSHLADFEQVKKYLDDFEQVKKPDCKAPLGETRYLGKNKVISTNPFVYWRRVSRPILYALSSHVIIYKIFTYKHISFTYH